MSGILIIAYGNRLRCDDGLAWHVAEKLAQLNLSSEVEIIARHQLTPELALPVSQAATVLFIDAARAGVPGEITSGPLEPQQLSSVFTHEFSPGAILSVAQELYGRRAEAFAISLCGECFDHGETLSEKVEESLPRAVALVSELARLSKGTSDGVSESR
jgi:hydrogenase maturation protease